MNRSQWLNGLKVGDKVAFYPYKGGSRVPDGHDHVTVGEITGETETTWKVRSRLLGKKDWYYNFRKHDGISNHTARGLHVNYDIVLEEPTQKHYDDMEKQILIYRANEYTHFNMLTTEQLKQYLRWCCK